MKSLRVLAIGAALIAGGSALASAQPNDHRGDRDDYRGNHYYNGDRDDHRFRGDRDDRRFRGDRDDRRFRGGRPNAIYWRDNDDRRGYFDRDRGRVVVVNQPYYVGERRFFNGYYWTWDGDRWCRQDHGFRIFFRF
jgi:hypothetical protein